jgi:hypothetical protein
MRMLLKVVFGLEASNDAVRNGTIGPVQQALLDRIKPEAAYFGAENGVRTGYLFFDLVDASQIPVIAEPLFQQLGASVDFIPVMNLEDLQKGLAEAGG